GPQLQPARAPGSQREADVGVRRQVLRVDEDDAVPAGRLGALGHGPCQLGDRYRGGPQLECHESARLGSTTRSVPWATQARRPSLTTSTRITAVRFVKESTVDSATSSPPRTGA